MRNKRILSFLVALISLLTLLPAASAASDVYVGQTFYFGNYEQDGNLRNGDEPILWRVYSVDYGSRTVRAVSEYGLDSMGLQPLDQHHLVAQQHHPLVAEQHVPVLRVHVGGTGAAEQRVRQQFVGLCVHPQPVGNPAVSGHGTALRHGIRPAVRRVHRQRHGHILLLGARGQHVDLRRVRRRARQLLRPRQQGDGV